MNSENNRPRWMFDQDSLSQGGNTPPAAPRQMFDQDAPRQTWHRQPQPGGVPGFPPAGPPRAQRTPVQRGAPPPAVHQSRRAAERRRKRRRRRVALASVLLVVTLLAGFMLWGYNSVSEQIHGEDTEAGSVPEAITTQALPEYTGKGIICGLICGIDYDNETADGYVNEANKVGNTDLILYLMYNTETNKANVLYIPRDMYVGEEPETNGLGRINALYRNSADSSNRVAALATVLYDQLRLPTDFYVTIDMDALKAIVEHYGFVPTYVPQPITDQSTGNMLINEGWQNITSQEVEYLVRNRNYAGSDRTRQLTQMYFLSALFRQLKQLAPTDLLPWMRIVLYYCKVGGINTMQIGGLAQKALGLESEDLTFVQLPVSGAWYTPSKGPQKGVTLSEVCLVPEETAEVLDKYFRPDGHSVPVSELDIHTLPVNEYGQGPAEIRTMADIQDTEPGA